MHRYKKHLFPCTCQGNFLVFVEIWNCSSSVCKIPAKLESVIKTQTSRTCPACDSGLRELRVEKFVCNCCLRSFESSCFRCSNTQKCITVTLMSATDALLIVKTNLRPPISQSTWKPSRSSWPRLSELQFRTARWIGF